MAGSWLDAVDTALVRDVSPALERCELTHVERVPIDLPRAIAQHEAYVDGLRRRGLTVVRVDADPACPDCCFVEDTAVVLDEVAVLTPLGTLSRRAETPAIAAALAPYRRVERMALPASLEGGDVLRLGRAIYVGLTTRTNEAGIAALRTLAAPFGYTVTAVPVTGCLHLKSAVTALDDETVLANPAWFDVSPLRGVEIVAVDPAEPGAANAFRIRGEVWLHPGFPRTRDLVARRGTRVVDMDISEFIKAEAALTCKSLLFRA